VEENVAFPLDRHSDLWQAERKERVGALLATVGMEQHGKKLPSQISGGMQKRVGLARALALEPELMLFDEPTAGLDPITAAEINQLILDLQEKRKITSIVVTHDIRGARTVSHRLVLLKEGNIVAEGTFEELKKNQDPFVVRFLLGDT
jgi:phospholipid/cholesterol/gamma-HCH transport system ATP-binding protein